MKRQQVQETVFNGSQYEGDGWPPEDPAGFMAWFQERIERIPLEFRSVARIDLGYQREYYDSCTVTIEITYMHDETDEQMKGRIEREAAKKLEVKAKELSMLAQLQKKYGK